MCNACGFYCCAYDGFSGCGCDHCDCPECWSDDEFECDSDDDWGDEDRGDEDLGYKPDPEPQPALSDGTGRDPSPPVIERDSSRDEPILNGKDSEAANNRPEVALEEA